MFLVFTHMPGESYCRWLRSLLLYLCDVYQELINSFVCWFCLNNTNRLIRLIFKFCSLYLPQMVWLIEMIKQLTVADWLNVLLIHDWFLDWIGLRALFAPEWFVWLRCWAIDCNWQTHETGWLNGWWIGWSAGFPGCSDWLNWLWLNEWMNEWKCVCGT